MTSFDIHKAPVHQVVAFLKDRVGELGRDDRPFAYSLIGAAEGRGLTDKQALWVRKMADRIIHPRQEPKPQPLGNVAGLLALFDKAAASGLKYPKLRALAGETALTLWRAGSKSRHVGQVMVVAGKGEERVYYGRVDLAGTFHPSHKVEPAQLAQAVPALVALATDPAAAAKAYGQRTGNCCFCSLPLDDGRSIEAGYGPVCAENFGMPWGQARRRRAKGRG